MFQLECASQEKLNYFPISYSCFNAFNRFIDSIHDTWIKAMWESGILNLCESSPRKLLTGFLVVYHYHSHHHHHHYHHILVNVTVMVIVLLLLLLSWIFRNPRRHKHERYQLTGAVQNNTWLLLVHTSFVDGCSLSDYKRRMCEQSCLFLPII